MLNYAVFDQPRLHWNDSVDSAPFYRVGRVLWTGLSRAEPRQIPKAGCWGLGLLGFHPSRRSPVAEPLDRHHQMLALVLDVSDRVIDGPDFQLVIRTGLEHRQ